MVDEAQFFDIALSFEKSLSKPNFERTGFLVQGKKMFATHLGTTNTANLFLSVDEQRQFCAISPNHIYPIKGVWGERGATTFELNHLDPELVTEALVSAFKKSLG